MSVKLKAVCRVQLRQLSYQTEYEGRMRLRFEGEIYDLDSAAKKDAWQLLAGDEVWLGIPDERLTLASLPEPIVSKTLDLVDSRGKEIERIKRFISEALYELQMGRYGWRDQVFSLLEAALEPKR